MFWFQKVYLFYLSINKKKSCLISSDLLNPSLNLKLGFG